ncbi:uncharacterized protein DNG_01498 [Cephalotrichum gorgonifer]|uniref:Uncharacterized protein n=1 Tax=Cephalotrichum gorgonifer TaxID=2041049 RepID=A0AAE8MRT4_9PEZI|nr:uncharacterized protein DNG_01498 [Cephalotrichum gorgonifer]
MVSHADDWIDYDYGDDDDDDGASRNEVPVGTSSPDLPSPGLEGVRNEARKRSKNIASSFNTLRAIVERHEAAIQRRWVKKIKRQRLKTLLAAWPNMAVSHRPDFKASRNSLDKRESNLRYRTELMWPYINQEDLSQERSLLLLINSRGRHTPPNFTGADFSAISCFMPKVKPGATLHPDVMILQDVTNAKDYGKLLGWHEHKDAKDWMDIYRQFRTDEGLLVLEVQEQILAFLVDCCRQILHDISQETLTSDAFPFSQNPN